MTEHFSLPSLENKFDGRLSEGMLKMMNFEAAMLGHKPPLHEDSFDPDATINFGKLVHKHSALFDSLFTNSGFHPAAAYPNTAKLVKLSLLTAPYIVMQERKDRTNSRYFRAEMSKYNDVMIEAIRANPDVTKRGLMLVLQGATMWANMPRASRYQSEKNLEMVINGASSELAAEQLLTSVAAQEAGLILQKSSVDDDLKGIDFIVTLADERELRLDIKSNPEQVDASGPIILDRPRYEILDDDKVKIYTGAGDVLRQGKLHLDQYDITRKSTVLVETIHEIADVLSMIKASEVRNILAELALRIQK